MCVHMAQVWCGRVHGTVGGATPGQPVLACIRKQAEQGRKSKPVSAIPPWFLLLFLLDLLPDFPP